MTANHASTKNHAWINWITCLCRQFFSSKYAMPDAASLHILTSVFCDCLDPCFLKKVNSAPPVKKYHCIVWRQHVNRPRQNKLITNWFVTLYNVLIEWVIDWLVDWLILVFYGTSKQDRSICATRQRENICAGK